MPTVAPPRRRALRARPVQEVSMPSKGLRPDPRAINAPMTFDVPDRIFRTEGLSLGARVTAVALCCLARQGQTYLTSTNSELCRISSASTRGIDTFLGELEAAGLIYRIARWLDSKHDDLKKLEAIGFTWSGPLPPRIIVLLWRLPQPGSLPDEASLTRSRT